MAGYKNNTQKTTFLYYNSNYLEKMKKETKNQNPYFKIATNVSTTENKLSKKRVGSIRKKYLISETEKDLNA